MRRRQHGGVRSCAFTNEQSSRGVYKEAGACALTRAVRDGIKDSSIRYTKCDGCKATMCCSCLDLIADAVLEHSVRVDFSQVWAALLVRPWRVGSDPAAGFDKREGGGGKWLKQCPLCVQQHIAATAPPLPATLSGVSYLQLQRADRAGADMLRPMKVEVRLVDRVVLILLVLLFVIRISFRKMKEERVVLLVEVGEEGLSRKSSSRTARLRLVEDLTVLIAQHPRAAASPLKNDFAPAFVNE